MNFIRDWKEALVKNNSVSQDEWFENAHKYLVKDVFRSTPWYFKLWGLIGAVISLVLTCGLLYIVWLVIQLLIKVNNT